MIYFITQECDKFVKIGYTLDKDSLVRRLSSLQTANPHRLEIFGTMRGGYKAESFLHNKFKPHRVDRKREWFYCGPIIDEIRRIMDEDRFLASRHSRPMSQSVVAYKNLMDKIGSGRKYTTERYLRDGFKKADIYPKF